MGLNDLQLSPELIARLYPSSLVTMDEQLSYPAPEPAVGTAEESLGGPAWKSLGDNQQKILIVVNYEGLVHLPDEELNFLTGMLAACKLGLGDVAIINQANYKEMAYKNLLSHFQSRIVFLFGVDPLSFGLPVGFPPYQVQQVAGCTFLHTPALEERNTDPLLKSKLWVCLRGIFGI